MAGDTAQGWCRTRRDGPVWVVLAGGQWTLATAGALDAELTRLQPPKGSPARFDLSALEVLDTAGAWLLYRLQRRLENDGATVEITGAAPQDAALLQRMAPREDRVALARPGLSPLLAVVERVGAATIAQAREARDLLNFFGLVSITFGRTLLNPRRLRFTALVAHIEQVGFNSMPIVGLLSFLIGVVLAYQGADQL